MAIAPAPINTIPQGFLGLLQIKQTGKNPANLLDEVAPNLEMFPFYAQRLGTVLVASGTDSIALPTATFSVSSFTTTVPQNEAWWVQFMTVAGSLLAAETITNLACVLKSGLQTLHVVSPYYSDTITARNRGFRVTGSSFWAPPGSGFGIQVGDDLTAATITVNLQITGFRAPV